MSVLPIVKGVDNKILRTVSQPVKKIDKEILKLIDKMIPTMHKAEGVGLAAPQVGENIRLFVMKLFRSDVERYSVIEMINPEILEVSDEMLKESEGCLSVPGVYGIVPRHERLTVGYLNKKGEKHFLELKGLNARIVQHETDHLNGTLCVDKMIEITETPDKKTKK